MSNKPLEFRLNLETGKIIDNAGKIWDYIEYIEYDLFNDTYKTLMMQRFEEFSFNIEKLRDFYKNN